MFVQSNKRQLTICLFACRQMEVYNWLDVPFLIMYIRLEEIRRMATSSIKKNFTVAGTKQLESFIKAVDHSLKAPALKSQVKSDFLSGVSGLRKLSRLRKKNGF